MSETFVDLSYRGLSLAKRIKLTQVRAATGYLELPAPMPVGTTLGIATDDGVLLEAVVAEVHEQTGGATVAPGMLVKPNLSVETQASWWRSLAEPDPRDRSKAPPPPDADGKVTVVSQRMSVQSAVPELMDDGRDTGVMDAIDAEIADVESPASLRDTQPSVAPAVVSPRRGVSRDTIATPMRAVTEDGEPKPSKRATTIVDEPVPPEPGNATTTMDAVDLAALGLASPDSSTSMKPEDYSDDFGGDTPPPAASDKTAGAKPSKRKRKKRS